MPTNHTNLHEWDGSSESYLGFFRVIRVLRG